MIEDTTEEKKVEVIEKPKDNRIFWLKFITGALVGGSLIALYITNAAEVSVMIPLIILGISLVIFIASFFFKKIASKIEPASDTPKIHEPIGKEKVVEIFKETAKDLMENIVRNPAPKFRSYNVNNNLIYVILAYLSPSFKLKYFIINATYPDRIAGVEDYPLSKDGKNESRKLKEFVNNASSNPDKKDTETVELTDPFTGRMQRIQKTRPYRRHVNTERRENVL